jgi:hypothetical protein
MDEIEDYSEMRTVTGIDMDSNTIEMKTGNVYIVLAPGVDKDAEFDVGAVTRDGCNDLLSTLTSGIIELLNSDLERVIKSGTPTFEPMSRVVH